MSTIVTINNWKSAAMALCLLLTLKLSAQEIVGLNLYPHACAGRSFVVTFGHSDTNTVQISLPEASLGHADTIFLPDGVSCGTMGCSYQSPVVFTDFPSSGPGSTITSVNDIKYVRLKMEHSYIGDIHINLTCPNNHSASLLNFSGYGTSDCTSSIPQSRRGWQEGNNMDNGTFLGNPIDDEDYLYPCNSNRPDNAPGTGWNYCWSNNNNSGYTYGSGDGIIYRAGNTVNIGGGFWGNQGVDSSNVAAGTHFYHPDQSFSSLIGCPLNGSWRIEVIDGWSGDNGYIFEWELALDPSLIPTTCQIDSRQVVGPNVGTINDSTFRITAPSRLDHDTCIQYLFRINTSCGTLDTVTTICFHPSYTRTVDTVACGSFEWWGQTYTESTIIRDPMLSSFDCDSSFNLNLVIHPTYNTTEREVVCEGSPTHYGFSESGIWTLPFESEDHCDSIVTYSLTVNPVYELLRRDTICDNDSITFDGQTINTTGHYEAHYQTVARCDSNILLDLVVHPTFFEKQQVTICSNSDYTWIDGNTYTETTHTPTMTYANMWGCDSTYRLLLNVDNSFQARMRATPTIVSFNNQEVLLEDISHGRSRSWDIGGESDTNIVVHFVYPLEVDSMLIALHAVSRGGCSDDTSVVIRADLARVWVPNVFTPDENQNRVFAIATYDIVEAQITIYDRSGLYITSFDALTDSWDGTNDGKPCPQGAYVWLLTYVSKAQPLITQKEKGSVLLLR
ncbi:MAG: gliding motility-associated C-terminal domain-containing protein [Bacteroidales bacterium]|nr:gliding motility-associated C-terminal domain-containing protein [Bacteroidales bacterium]